MATDADHFGWQPVIDASETLVAHALTPATPAAIGRLCADEAFAALLAHRRVYLPCPAELLGAAELETPTLPADRIVLVLSSATAATPEYLSRLEALRRRGFELSLALDGAHTDDWLNSQLFDSVAVSARVAGDRLDSHPRELAGRTRTFMATDIDRTALAAHCRQTGYSLCQGFYFAASTTATANKAEHSQPALMRLLGRVMEDADATALETELKREPGLAVNLMRLTNSAATGMRVRITSLRHAIMVLGRKQLQRWLQLLLYTQPGGSDMAGRPLLQLAATRGRFLELAAEYRRAESPDLMEHAFLTGILSLTPALMHMPLEKILQNIHVAGAVQLALEQRGGTLGNLLRLCAALENESPREIAARASDAGLSATAVNHCLIGALAWASSIGHEAD